jgi:hypothetical protein
MEKKDITKKVPPQDAVKSVQHDLFGQFITNDVNKVSNTVEIWESIPKYFFTPRQVEKLRTETGHADPFEWPYMDGKVVIQPALIKVDGKYKAFFPSVTEELVEEALKRIFTDQQYGLHNPNPNNPESWVRFTLRMLYKELKARGKTRSIVEIKHAVEVMSSCIIVVYNGKKEIWRGAILQDLVTVGREDYVEDTEAHHVARLPLFISHSINRLEYRQFNYDRLMTCKEQLSRWIYKRLINRYRQANYMNDYHFMYSDLKNSGLLQQATETDNRKKALSALNELVKKGVISRFVIEEKKEKRKITDMKYTVYPSTEFVGEQKAANKRAKDGYMNALNSGLSIVDKC